MPLLSVTTTRGASSAGLVASTVTPGSTAFEVSRTVPVIVACPNAAAGSTKTAAANTRHFTASRMDVSLERVIPQPPGCGQESSGILRDHAGGVNPVYTERSRWVQKNGSG